MSVPFSMAGSTGSQWSTLLKFLETKYTLRLSVERQAVGKRAEEQSLRESFYGSG